MFGRSRQTRREGRRPTSREAKRRNAALGGIALGILAIIAISAPVAYHYLNPKPIIDPSTNCPLSGPVSYTAVIIDATDTINATQKVAMENELARIRSEIPRFGAFAIYALSSNIELTKPEFALCNPGRADEIDWVTEGKILAERRWRDGFQKPLDEALTRSMSTASDAKSPLLEAIRSVSVQSFGPLRSNPSHSVPKRLVLFSDMLQNSENLNVYQRIPATKEYLNSESYRRVRSDLRDVDVAIFLIRRQTRGNIQRPELLRLWEDVIPAQGGRLVHFKPLEG